MIVKKVKMHLTIKNTEFMTISKRNGPSCEVQIVDVKNKARTEVKYQDLIVSESDIVAPKFTKGTLE